MVHTDTQMAAGSRLLGDFLKARARLLRNSHCKMQ